MDIVTGLTDARKNIENGDYFFHTTFEPIPRTQSGFIFDFHFEPSGDIVDDEVMMRAITLAKFDELIHEANGPNESANPRLLIPTRPANSPWANSHVTILRQVTLTRQEIGDKTVYYLSKRPEASGDTAYYISKYPETPEVATPEASGSTAVADMEGHADGQVHDRRASS
ncbi:hypothetical protein BO71DRAFT_445207 [Aspergillus ellipticus CBS 707.79]|uniref:Uncharacterized protein n=1 Tax=Aspergillus ellipticus CBS 707.79 TaxID=1448320 RepID=A0A319CT91_9EURO|nr:hypothetical protein BO71DRAFT_445207 [Aspergillus ellipticus CBS 707.79]